MELSKDELRQWLNVELPRTLGFFGYMDPNFRVLMESLRALLAGEDWFFPEIHLDAYAAHVRPKVNRNLDPKRTVQVCRRVFQAFDERFKEARYLVGRRKGKTRLLFREDEDGLKPLSMALDDLLGPASNETVNANTEAEPSSDGEPLTADAVLESLGENAVELARFHVLRLDLFGSLARGEAGPDSDLDFLVTFEGGKTTSADYFGLKFFLEDLFARKVDLVARPAVSPRWLERIERYAVHVA